MTLQEFRNLLRGNEKDTEIVFETPDGERYTDISIVTQQHAKIVVKIRKEKPKLTPRELVDPGPIPF